MGRRSIIYEAAPSKISNRTSDMRRIEQIQDPSKNTKDLKSTSLRKYLPTQPASPSEYDIDFEDVSLTL